MYKGIFLEHFKIMSELCKEDENGKKFKTFIDTYCIEYLNKERIFANEYKDLDNFRQDFDKYSDMLKILCGIDRAVNKDKPALIYSADPKFDPSKCINDNSNGYGTMGFLSLVLTHFQEEQKKHNCVAMEISQTPFFSSHQDNGKKYSKYFDVVKKWTETAGNLPLAFISTCVRDLPGGTLNDDVIASTMINVVKAIGVASSEKPPKGQPYLCPDKTLINHPWGMRAWLEKLYLKKQNQSTEKIDYMVEQIKQAYKSIGQVEQAYTSIGEVNLNNENSVITNKNNSSIKPFKLIPHVGEEYYGDDGNECLESVNSYLHFNDTKVINSLENKKIKLFFKLERIAHGCQCARSIPLLKKLNKQQVTCELCLTSNDNILSTKVTDNAIFLKPPVITMLNANVPVILCSDDPAIFTQGNEGCILNSEYLKLYKMLLANKKTHGEALIFLKDIANRSIKKSLALSNPAKIKYIGMNNILRLNPTNNMNV